MVADMTKVGAALTARAIRTKGVFISDIVIYGLLIDIDKDAACPYKLHISFENSKSTLWKMTRRK